MVWAKVMPSAEAADTWPLETLWRPARMISEEYAASNRGKPTSTEAKRVSVLGPSPSTVRKSWGTMRKNQSSTITSGTERNRLTYPAAKTASGFSGESRIIASSVPQTMPAATATKVNSSESTIPFQRNGSAPGIELQSISYIAAPFRLAIGGADEPWNAGVLLHLPHDQHDRNVDDQIEDRDRDERFVGLRSVVDELAPLCSQLEQADGRADRRVFEGIEHFGSERRHDEPTGHRQEHVTVGLGKCEPQRQGGVLLTARERVDARAHLLADAARCGTSRRRWRRWPAAGGWAPCAGRPSRCPARARGPTRLPTGAASSAARRGATPERWSPQWGRTARTPANSSGIPCRGSVAALVDGLVVRAPEQSLHLVAHGEVEVQPLRRDRMAEPLVVDLRHLARGLQPGAGGVDQRLEPRIVPAP